MVRPRLVTMCVRNHQRQPTKNGTCAECHREGAILRARVRRLYRTLRMHDLRCGVAKLDCGLRAEIVRRIAARTHDLNEWRGLGLRRLYGSLSAHDRRCRVAKETCEVRAGIQQRIAELTRDLTIGVPLAAVS